MLRADRISTRGKTLLQCMLFSAALVGCTEEPQPVAETAKDCGGKDCGDAGHGKFECVNHRCELKCSEGFGRCADDTACETPLQTSRDHCGACDKDCSEGYCQEGKCVEPKVQAKDLAGVESVSQLGDELRLIKAGTHFERASYVRLSNGDLEPVERTRIMPGAYADGTFFGCESPLEGDTCQLSRESADHKQSTKITKLDRVQLQSMAVDGESLYVGVELGDDDPSGVMRILQVSLPSGNVTKVYDVRGPLGGMAAYQGNVFWCESHQLKVLRVGSREPALLATKCGDLQTHEGFVYFMDASALFRVPLQGGPVEWVLTLRSDLHAAGFRILDDRIYYGAGGTEVRRPFVLREIRVPPKARLTSHQNPASPPVK